MRIHASASSPLLALGIVALAMTGVAHGGQRDVILSSDTVATNRDGEVTVTARALGNFREHRARLDLTFVFSAKRDDGSRVKGDLVIDWGDEKSDAVKLDRRAQAVHSWREEGVYRVRYVLTTRKGERVKGNFRFQVQPILRAFLSVLGERSPRLEEEERYRFLAMERDTRNVPGILTIDWGDGSEVVTLAKFDGDVSRKHIYTTAGDYTILAELLVNERKYRTAIPVTATDTAVPDLSDVISLHARDIASWRVTSTVTNVTISGSQICIFHTKQGRWPVITESDGDRLEGNPWVVAKVGNRWYAATYEWIKPAQACKGITKNNIGAHTGRSPLTPSWRPAKGEILGFFVSTVGRLNERTSNERSNVWEREFPY